MSPMPRPKTSARENARAIYQNVSVSSTIARTGGHSTWKSPSSLGCRPSYAAGQLSVYSGPQSYSSRTGAITTFTTYKQECSLQPIAYIPETMMYSTLALVLSTCC